MVPVKSLKCVHFLKVCGRPWILVQWKRIGKVQEREETEWVERVESSDGISALFTFRLSAFGLTRLYKPCTVRSMHILSTRSYYYIIICPVFLLEITCYFSRYCHLYVLIHSNNIEMQLDE